MATKQIHKLIKNISILLMVAVLLAATLSSFTKVYGLGAITSMWAVETNMDASGSSQLWLAFKTSAAGGTPGTITVTLTGATVATTNPNLAPVTTGCGGASGAFNFLNSGAGATALPGTLNATGATNVISLTGATTLTASTIYCVVFSGAAAVVNPASAGVNAYTITDTQDTGTEYYATLTGGTNESISVTATVPQSFTLTLSGTSDALSSLSTGSVTSSGGINATVSSNAASGVGLFAYDSNGALHSPSTGHNISSTSPNNVAAQTITTAAEGYIMNAVYQSTTGGAALTVDTPFAGTAGTGDGLSTTPSELAYNAAPTNAAIVKVKESATITATTPAATDYADTITIVGAGSF